MHGRQLIPDKENPPQEILDWVSQFSRWSHAERLLALDQLIESCEPQQVRHMMQVLTEPFCMLNIHQGEIEIPTDASSQVIEPQFQRDFISLLPKELAL